MRTSVKSWFRYGQLSLLYSGKMIAANIVLAPSSRPSDPVIGLACSWSSSRRVCVIAWSTVPLNGQSFWPMQSLR